MQRSPVRIVKHALLWASLLLVVPAAKTSVALAESATASAGPDSTTSELMRRGFAELQRENLEAAREAFAAAWVKSPAVVVALSLAQVEMRLGRFADAAERWQYLLTHLPQSASDERESAREQLERCRSHVGSITLQVVPDGATVVVDDKPVGQAPLNRELFLEPGAHVIYVTHGGRRSAERTIQISTSSRLSFRLSVPEAPSTPKSDEIPGVRGPAAASSSPATFETAPTSSLRKPVLVVGGVVAVSAAALGIFFAIESEQANDQASSARAAAEAARGPSVPRNGVCFGAGVPESCDRLASSVEKADRFHNLAVGAFVGAGALGAATVAGVLLWKDSGVVGGRASGRELALNAALGPVPGMKLSGRF